MTERLPAELFAKRERLLELIRGYGSCLVAFSGGVDSEVVAKAARLALGDGAVAATCCSASTPAGQLEEATRLARQIGIRREVVATGELSIPEYRDNEPDRCYHCKIEILTQLQRLAEQLHLAVMADGGNRDDQAEYRPGLKAVRERNIKSPLADCGLSKAEVRQIAQSWGLPWQKPASPCLSTRIAYGERITPERLAMVDRAEAFLRDRGLGMLRVRYHKGDVAWIEAPVDELPRFVEERFRREVVEYLKSLGFKYVAIDLEGFRSGSMNAVLPVAGGEQAS
jgi:uncharacterized protein